MRIRPGVELAGLSDVGCLRPNNEDAYTYWEPARTDQFQRQGRLAIVADGMGGHEGGQEASRIAVDTVKQVYSDASGNNPRDGLMAGFHVAHEQILLYGQKYPLLQGLGTTCTAIVLVGMSLYYAHIGDSRLYLIRESKAQRLTQDHSYVGKLLDSGIIGAAEAAVHPHRNILLKALGVGATIEPEIPEQPVLLQANDVLLLCTDGLWSVVSEDEMLDAVATGTPSQACQALVGKAKERGGPDNITLQLIRIIT
jgi:serine/threonine protein phosphatase PrpC